MLGFYFLFFISLGMLKMIFPQFEIDQYQQSDINRLLEEDPWRLVLLAVVFAPIIEEGMFRTLIKPSQNELIFFLCSWLLVIGIAIIPENINWLIKFGFLFLSFILSFIFLKEFIPENWQRRLCTFLNKHYRILWLLTAVIFGMVHIYNYVEGFDLNFVLFLLIVPRIIAGYFFGKIKIENHGLFWPIAMHAMNNGIVFLILLPKILLN
ncbi:CPBP family intramembrane metalloprotease [Antarcticibacterium arcticum]|uniref:CPBP family intramembrane metalloprotease n=2 Tax=Antarcticibacterium arcticum TaxID=2585771 RepID=A0A5B8YR96_9FLAO|nr:CPBP family intramembrane metalloprotease [Antarcticibacterium arcticum]